MSKASLVSAALFRHADTPQTMLALSDPILLTILRPAGKYRQNAKRIKEICSVLLESYEGRVPRDEHALLSLPGVGRKTANIVRSHAYAVEAIAVDTHVQWITNRLGWVNTADPPQTEATLKRIIPRKFWRSVNRVFVRHGQVICTPRSPFCFKCPVFRFCRRVGVRRSR